MSSAAAIARVLVDVPRAAALDYAIPDALIDDARGGALRGCLCIVPLGARKVTGVIVDVVDASLLPASRLKRIDRLFDLPALPESWLRLTQFAAQYYHHGWGETAIASLPLPLRRPAGPRRDSALAKLRAAPVAGARPCADVAGGDVQPALLAEQCAAVEAIKTAQGFGCYLLFGVTGSGKTEVYLEAMSHYLSRSSAAQVLLLVPEINLTPQLEERVRARFDRVPVVSLHSGLADGARASAWLAALDSRVRIVLGTRSAVFVPMPGLTLICVDEEHDPSYKAGDGIRFSARDLAVKRAQLEGIPVVLGSATPSIESWSGVRGGRHRLLPLPQRAPSLSGAADCGPVAVHTVDLREFRRQQGLTGPVRDALAATLARGEQSLVFINRRGYAPVLSCEPCGWLSACPRCAAFAAFHRADGVLRCHHCGWSVPVPHACPSCGNQDLTAVGAGTQRVEESLQDCLPSARISRLDRDSARGKDVARDTLDAMHAGEVDVLVGTQMLTKGHDFRRVTTVIVLNVDAQLVSHDFRASERLFATLTQVIGRAGRAGLASQALIETRFPRHPLFTALARGDYAAFADAVLEERRRARLPPNVHQALLSTESRTMAAALALLEELKPQLGAAAAGVSVYDPVPMALSKRANVYRAQLLIEADRRAALHAALRGVDPTIVKGRRPGVRLRIEVDPQEI